MAPKVIVSLGNFASRTLLDVTAGVTRFGAGPIPTGARRGPDRSIPPTPFAGGGVVIAEMRADLVRAKRFLK